MDIEKQILELNQKSMKYKQTYQYQQALHFLQTASNLSRTQQVSNRIKAMTFNNLGCIYQKLNRHKKALITLNKALHTQSQDLRSQAGTHLNISSILSNKNDHQQAIFHSLQALKILQSLPQKKESDFASLIFAIEKTSVLYQHLGDYQKCQRLLQRGLNLTKVELGSSHKLTLTVKSLRDRQKARQKIVLRQKLTARSPSKSSTSLKKKKETSLLKPPVQSLKTIKFSLKPLKRLRGNRSTIRKKSSKILDHQKTRQIDNRISIIAKKMNYLQERLHQFSRNCEPLKNIVSDDSSLLESAHRGSPGSPPVQPLKILQFSSKQKPIRLHFRQDFLNNNSPTQDQACQLTHLSRLPFSQIPFYLPPFEVIKTPSPSCFPSFHQPQYFLWFGQVKTPNPYFLSYKKAPQQVLPSTQEKSPFPCILLFFHSPTYLLPSAQQQLPIPSLQSK